MTTKDQIEKMSDAEFKKSAWAILTNYPGAGGASKSARPAARRKFRKMGGRMFLALNSQEHDGYRRTFSEWGILWPGQPAPEGDIVEIATSTGAAAHKLGGGCAKRGWKLYWSH